MTVCEAGNELLKSHPSYQLSVPFVYLSSFMTRIGCMLNMDACLFNLSKELFDKKMVGFCKTYHAQFPSSDYLYSDDPLLLNEPRFYHDVDKSKCTVNHSEQSFGTRCIWLLCAALYRSIKSIVDIREKALRNLSRICPNGYRSVNDINPDNIVPSSQFMLTIE